MLIYLAGPYRAVEGKSVERHIQEARTVAIDLWQQGHYVLCPHLNTAHFDRDASDIPDKAYLAGTLEMLRRCDAMVVQGDWESSEGTKEEIAYAESVGMPIYCWPGQSPVASLTESRCPEQCTAFLDTVMQMYRVHLSKNSDYSPANILGTGEMGVIVRAWDKIARLLNLYGFNLEIAKPATLAQPREPKHESIDDTWMDMAVYGIIGMLIRAGKWGK